MSSSWLNIVQIEYCVISLLELENEACGYGAQSYNDALKD